MAYDAYYEYYENKGYFFDRSVLTTYALSLYSKPFVILSGISGTGKTKIAQFFNVPATAALSSGRQPVAPRSAIELPGSWILMRITAGVTTGDGRANFQYKDIAALLDAEELASIQPRIEVLKAAGNEDNICEPFEFAILTPDGTELKAMAYLQRASSPLLRIRFKSKRGEAPYDSTQYFAENYQVGDVLRLEKIGAKRLQIVSVNDEQVQRKSKELEQAETARVKNSCFISVRSDWTDPSAMFGYYNLVEQKYNITPLISFILRAHEHPELPFFLILDEMNLAKVEHYFSDFLSCLESRHVDEAGVLQQEPIRLHAGSGWVESNDDYFDLIPTALSLPHNLFVTGTVNIDESTYMFSPKVLDRANVIELNDVDIEGYGRAQAAATAAPDGFVIKAFPPFDRLRVPSREDYMKLNDGAKSLLGSVHGILCRYQLHFGYRVINEVSSYINNAQDYCEPHPGLVDDAFDHQMVQKILPKLSGPQSKLEAPIRDLLALLCEEHENGRPLESLLSVDARATRYPRAVSKLQRIANSLLVHGFAHYIE